MDCIFCKIVKGDIPSSKVYEDDKMLAFNDINPMAPVHVLVIPKCHIESLDKVDASNSDVIKAIFEKIPEIAKAAGVTNGYRLISNCGADACQSVKHLHFHILGGKQLPENMA
nr:histidine triad nucleotide-binding protein [Clostridia bacterium]